MSIATLSTIALTNFKGSANVTKQDSASLVGIINTVIAKVNAVIADINLGSVDVLDVGSGTGAYYGTSDSWLTVDGTNPPTLSRLRIQDVTDGSFGTIINTSGTLSVI